MIPSNILKSEFDKLVNLEIEKINISESIKLIKEVLNNEGMEKSEVNAVCKIASAKAKEKLTELDDAANKIKEMLDLVG